MSSSRPSDDEVMDDQSSQAVMSDSEEEGPPAATTTSTNNNSAPQFIMPSIMMPSRRPFSDKGLAIGRLKILLAGASGLYNCPLVYNILTKVKVLERHL